MHDTHSFREGQTDRSASANSHVSAKQECLPDNEADTASTNNFAEGDEFPSDDDDDLLQQAIMLSLQQDFGDDHTSDAVNFQVWENPPSYELVTRASTSSSNVDATTMQPSRLANLPLELKEAICSYVFVGEIIVFRPEDDEKPRLVMVWGPHLSILLLCREFNAIAMRYLDSSEVVLDLRQSRIRNKHTGTRSSVYMLDDLLQNLPGLRSILTRLLIKQGQHFQCDDLATFLPALTNVELYDYKSCREIIRSEGIQSGAMFEYVVPMKTRSKATAQLRDFQHSLPPSICADLIYVCDTLICIPKYNDEHTSSDPASPKPAKPVKEKWKYSFLQGSKAVKEESSLKEEKRQEVAKQSTQFKTAKMVRL